MAPMKIMVSAGEVSGDVHGKYLVREIKKFDPRIYFFGIGSEKLKSEGVDVKFDIAKLGTIGIFEALHNIFPLYFAFKKALRLLKKERPDMVILIDSQGINMPLAKQAKKLGIKTVYYIPPQEWLWGTEHNAKVVAKTIDLILAIFKKESDAYKAFGGNVSFFGHPLLDIVKPSLSRAEVLKRFLGDENGPLIALCPGSRTQEIKGLFPIFLKAAELIKRKLPDVRFLIPAASNETLNMLSTVVKDFSPRAIVGHSYDIIAASDLALCASGTINIEASILGVPNIMIYKLSPLSYLFGKYILKIDKKLPFFSMPNILLEESVIPELFMDKANPETIAQEAISILVDPARQQKMKASFENLKTELGSCGSIAKYAQAVINFAS
jgi:lipid-A-disaccharide synthase